MFNFLFGTGIDIQYTLADRTIRVGMGKTIGKTYLQAAVSLNTKIIYTLKTC